MSVTYTTSMPVTSSATLSTSMTITPESQSLKPWIVPLPESQSLEVLESWESQSLGSPGSLGVSIHDLYLCKNPKKSHSNGHWQWAAWATYSSFPCLNPLAMSLHKRKFCSQSKFLIPQSQNPIQIAVLLTFVKNRMFGKPGWDN